MTYQNVLISSMEGTFTLDFLEFPEWNKTFICFVLQSESVFETPVHIF